MPFSLPRRSWLLGLSALALGGCATDAELSATPDPEEEKSLAELPLRVLVLQGAVPVYKALAPRLLVPVKAQAVPDTGTVPAVAESLWPYLQPGNSVDVLLAPMTVLEQLQAQNHVERGSLRPLVSTPLAVLVQAGQPLPALERLDDLRQLLLRARALAYPSSDGSTYIEQTLLPQLGVKTQVLLKSIKAFGPQVAQLVARGRADLGIQSLAELQQAEGIQIVGKLPPPLDYTVVYGAALATHGTTPDGAKALMHFFLREVPGHDWRGSGWESVVPEAVDPDEKFNSDAYLSR